jgi:hypothetical protein
MPTVLMKYPRAHRQAPVSFFELWEISSQLFRTFAFDYLHYLIRGIGGWHRTIHMHMIRGYGPFDDIYIHPLAQLGENLFQSSLDLFDQYLLSILSTRWHKYDDILKLPF